MPLKMDPRRGLCGCCVKTAKCIPVVFISAIVLWSYYAYVVQLCLLTVAEAYEKILLLALYHVVFVLFVWAYWKTVFTSPGRVPKRFHLTSEEMDRIEGSDNHRLALEQIVIQKDLPCTMRSLHQEIRYCSECSLIKPDRAHHCSVCGHCVLKMDHHCPWVNNCVAFSNYKFFVLFLGYALTYCVYIALSSLKYFLLFWTTAGSTSGESGKFHVLFLFFVSAMFSISLASLFFYHLYLVSKNMTTLEAFRTPITRNGPDKLVFHLGKFSNFQEIFGDNKWSWFLPVFTSFGDGIVYPQRGTLDEEAGLLNGQDGQSPPGSSGGAGGLLGGTTQCPSTYFSEEENVPMMPATGGGGGGQHPPRWGSNGVGPSPGGLENGSGGGPAHRSSSSSSEDSEDLLRPRSDVVGTSPRAPSDANAAAQQELVAVNM